MGGDLLAREKSHARNAADIERRNNMKQKSGKLWPSLEEKPIQIAERVRLACKFRHGEEGEVTCVRKTGAGTRAIVYTVQLADSSKYVLTRSQIERI